MATIGLLHGVRRCLVRAGAGRFDRHRPLNNTPEAVMASLQWQSKRLTVVVGVGKQQPTDDDGDIAGFVSEGSGDYTPAPALQVLWDEEDDTPPEFGFRSTGEGQ